MKKSFEDYTLLAGNHGLRGSLWLGPDHLLVIEGKGFLLSMSEHYRRIDYKNIQALTLVQTSGRIWIALAFAVPMLLFAVGAVAALQEENWVFISLLVPALLLLTLLVVHLTLGRTCRCALQTAVLTLRLRPLVRVKKAQPLLDVLEDLCRRHQGEMPVERSVTPPLPTVVVPQLGVKPMWKGSRWVSAASLVCALWGLAIGAELFVAGIPFLSFNIFLGLAAFILTLIALVKALQHQSPGSLRGMLWGLLGLQFATGIIGYVFFIIAGFQHNLESMAKSNKADSSVEMLSRLADLSLEKTGESGWLFVALGALVMGLGFACFPYGRTTKAMTSNVPPFPPSMPPTLPPES